MAEDKVFVMHKPEPDGKFGAGRSYRGSVRVLKDGVDPKAFFKRRPDYTQVYPPDVETIMAWEWNDGGCETPDGCWVEPDGYCPHGWPSWMIVMGLI
jgi:hypothetical protein